MYSAEDICGVHTYMHTSSQTAKGTHIKSGLGNASKMMHTPFCFLNLVKFLVTLLDLWLKEERERVTADTSDTTQ